MTQYLRELKTLVERLPAGHEREWWNRYLWYRFNCDRLATVTLFCFSFLWLAHVFSFTPLNHAAFSLAMVSTLMFLFLNIIKSRMWNKKMGEES
jgi:hypothetical protein